MLINESCSNILFIENQGNFSLLWQVSLTLILLFMFCGHSFAQWVNNPSENTRLVVDAVNPINISSVEDLKGGAFIFWEENRNGIQNEIYFLHVDGNGSLSFRADGKQVSGNKSNKSNPYAIPSQPNTSVVVYKDNSRNTKINLYAQKVLNNGNLLWNANGIKVTETENEISDFSAASDKRGNTYIAFLTRDAASLSRFDISVQKLNAEGKILHKPDGIKVYESAYPVTQPNIIADQNGGAFLFWMENQENRSVIFGQHVDSTGKALWSKNPINISGAAKYVISYSVNSTEYGSIYIAWQVLGKDKDIYHQLIDTKGKVLWGANGAIATKEKGSQVNPQVLTGDSTIILSWTNEIGTDRDIYIQKYNRQGKPLWNDNGMPVVKLSGPQFGQKLISDGRGGAIAAWIDRRVDSLRGNIYAQRITSSGEAAWDNSAIPVATSSNTEKSYLSVVSDRRGGAIFIFRDRRKNKGEIYGQKIFNTGTYVSQIIGFNSEVEGDSVKISWYSANEMGETRYDIERTSQSDSASTDWEVIGTVLSDGQSSAKFYEYYDKPEIAGTIYYRVVQSDDKGNFQPSDVSKLNYIKESSDIIVGQNSPNPFDKETVIEFYLPQESRISVDFFNSRVEEIKKIDNELFPAGKNQIRFNAAGLQPGIYFYRFQCGEFVDVKKMVVTKPGSN